MEHYIPDGLLARFSVVGPDAQAALETMSRFIPLMIAHVAKDQLAPLVGTERAMAITGKGRSAAT
jgi:hypothetical protein